MRAQDIVITAGGFIITILLAGNIFFVSRMVDRLDKVEETTWLLRQQIVVLETKLNK